MQTAAASGRMRASGRGKTSFSGEPKANDPMSRKFLPVIVVAVACVLALLLIPYLQVIRDGEGWIYSKNQAAQIAQAIRNYQEAYGHLPPAVVKDAQGKPLYSWRVLVLPFLEGDALYKQFHLDEP